MRALFKGDETMEIRSRAVPARLLGNRSTRKGGEEEKRKSFGRGCGVLYKCSLSAATSSTSDI